MICPRCGHTIRTGDQVDIVAETPADTPMIAHVVCPPDGTDPVARVDDDHHVRLRHGPRRKR